MTQAMLIRNDSGRYYGVEQGQIKGAFICSTAQRIIFFDRVCDEISEEFTGFIKIGVKLNKISVNLSHRNRFR
jgi:hypothetical protein